jgi:NADH-quinone oxidoreductase subunit M
MGGIAFRAPVLSAVFLIVAFATLAMPGSANFVGELLILFGTFEDKLVYGLVASAGVVLAAVYMIRLLQRSMHYRAAPGVESKDLCPLEVGTLVPLTAIIVGFGVYPQLILHRTEAATTLKIREANQLARGVQPTPLPPPVPGLPVQPDAPPPPPGPTPPQGATGE